MRADKRENNFICLKFDTRIWERLPRQILVHCESLMRLYHDCPCIVLSRPPQLRHLHRVIDSLGIPQTYNYHLHTFKKSALFLFIGGNINIPVIMVAEKAADIIKKDLVNTWCNISDIDHSPILFENAIKRYMFCVLINGINFYTNDLF